MHRIDAWRMIKRRAQAIGLPEEICNHTFRATGITAYLENGGTIEHAQQIASHESPKTTKLYDRASDQITLDEIEKNCDLAMRQPKSDPALGSAATADICTSTRSPLMTQPNWKRLLKKFNHNPPATASAIDQFEAETGIGLPDAFRTFLMLSNGGEGFIGADDNYIILWPVNELVDMNKAYEVQKYAPGLFLIGSSGGGEAFAFDLRSEAKPVVSVPFVGMDESEILQLGKDFTTFLKGKFPW
jgi:hypothetical protein